MNTRIQGFPAEYCRDVWCFHISCQWFTCYAWSVTMYGCVYVYVCVCILSLAHLTIFGFWLIICFQHVFNLCVTLLLHFSTQKNGTYVLSRIPFFFFSFFSHFLVSLLALADTSCSCTHIGHKVFSLINFKLCTVFIGIFVDVSWTVFFNTLHYCLLLQS